MIIYKTRSFDILS